MNQLTTYETPTEAFELAQREAKALSLSSLMPKEHQGNIANCLIIFNMAKRIGAAPLMVAQSLNIIHGRPSWSSTFIISAINSCGRFTPLRFRETATECVAYATDKDTGDVVEGVTVTMQMAKAEGWLDKNGSKWKTMPQLMLRYRAATFFGRFYAPDILMGMRTADEADDIAPVRVMQVSDTSLAGSLEALAAEEPEEAVIDTSDHSAPETGSDDPF